MTKRRIVVSSPATIANFGPGFDSFGLCLDSPNDVVTLRRSRAGTAEVKVTGKSEGVPTSPTENTASYAALKLCELCGLENPGFSMTVKKGMKPGSGIGSSAASSVGGSLAMAALLDVKDREIVLEAAAMGEELISGTRHFDNVAAALYGGFTVVADVQNRKVIRIWPPPFRVVVAIPEVYVKTRDARNALPKTVELEDAVRNLSWASGMVHAMMRRNVRQVGAYLDDRLAVPHRKKLVPGFDQVRDRALKAGALGVSIGGSGPAVFAIAQENANEIRSAMVKAFKESVSLRAEAFIASPGKGATIEESQ